MEVEAGLSRLISSGELWGLPSDQERVVSMRLRLYVDSRVESIAVSSWAMLWKGKPTSPENARHLA
jgi:hypothetical protein